MQDCTGRELNIGDEVAFSVGTALVTGKIIGLRVKQYTANWSEDIAKVALTHPEIKPSKKVYRSDATGYLFSLDGKILYDMVPQAPTMFRNVEGSHRIILLKPLDS